MKNFLLLTYLFLLLFVAGCFNNTEVIDDCIIPEDCIENSDLQKTYLIGYGMEPFWDIEISGGMATFSSPMYETNVVEPITIRQEGENYYFSGEDLEGEFILKDCIDGGKGDMHYYTVGVAKIREYYYEGCGDGEDGIKMSDEDVPEDFYQYQPDEEELNMIETVQERTANLFSDMETCIDTLDQYQPEWMPGDPQTQITVACGVENYGDIFITGYIYTSVYPDLGLRITSPKGYDIFYVKSDTPIFVRDGNKISHGVEYIRVYEKSANKSLFDIVESNLNKGCFAQPVEYEGQNKIYGNINNNMIYEIVDNEGNIWGNCIADNESKEQDYTLVRYFESLDKTKYYKLVFTDGCAPGPCSMFYDVEVF